MTVVSLSRPTQQQLREVENKVDAYEAFLNALWCLKTPNYLVLEHELAAPDFSFVLSGRPATDLIGALDFIKAWHCVASSDFGRRHRTTELLYSTGGSRMACLDYQTITLTGKVTLPNGTTLRPLPGHSTRILHLRSAHYLRLVDIDGTHKIAEWRIASTVRNFRKFLN